MDHDRYIGAPVWKTLVAKAVWVSLIPSPRLIFLILYTKHFKCLDLCRSNQIGTGEIETAYLGAEIIPRTLWAPGTAFSTPTLGLHLSLRYALPTSISNILNPISNTNRPLLPALFPPVVPGSSQYSHFRAVQTSRLRISDQRRATANGFVHLMNKANSWGFRWAHWRGIGIRIGRLIQDYRSKKGRRKRGLW